MLMLLLMTMLASPASDSLEAFKAPYPAPVDTVLVGDRPIAYHEAGTGEETVVLIHGLGSNLALWRETIDPLADHFRVLALDLPGYGLSGKDEVPGTMDFFSDTVVQFMNAHGVDRAHVVGLSMGGQIALTVALDHPERLDRLVLVSPAGIETFTDQQGGALKSVYTPQAILAAPEAALQQNIAMNFASYDPERFGWLLEQRLALTALPDAAAYATANARSVAGMLDAPVAHRLDDIAAPTLVLYGAEDALIPNAMLNPHLTTADVAEEAAERIPNATLDLIKDAGHLPQLEQPEVVNQHLMTFLRRER